MVAGFSGVLGQDEASGFGVVVENLGVASPVHGGIELALDFVVAEVLVENVVEEFFGDGMVRLGVQHVVDLLQDDDVLERGLTEKHLAIENVGVGEGDTFGSDLDVAFLQRGESEQYAKLR